MRCVNPPGFGLCGSTSAGSRTSLGGCKLGRRLAQCPVSQVLPATRLQHCSDEHMVTWGDSSLRLTILRIVPFTVPSRYRAVSSVAIWIVRDVEVRDLLGIWWCECLSLEVLSVVDSSESRRHIARQIATLTCDNIPFYSMAGSHHSPIRGSQSWPKPRIQPGHQGSSA